MLLFAWYVLLFLLGATVGSFLNVCIYRIPHEKSILWPGSRCGNCLQPIRWYDNLPLLSYALLRGRCRRCGARFASRYFFIELLTGLGFAGLFYLEVIANVHDLDALDVPFFIRFGVIPWQGWVVFGFHAVLLSFLIVATFTDLDHMEIPLPITLTGAAAGLLGAVLFPWPWPYTPHERVWLPFPPPGPIFGGGKALMPRPALYPWPVWNELPAWMPPGSALCGLATGLAGLLVGALVLRVIAFLFKHGRGMEGLGVGDADLMMMVGCFLGWQPVVVAFFVALAPGLVFGLGHLIFRGGRELPIPFGPSLALGTVATWLCWRWIGPRLADFFFDGPLVVGVGLFLVVGLFVAFSMLGAVHGRGPPEDGAKE